jgi:hypothetical protein
VGGCDRPGARNAAVSAALDDRVGSELLPGGAELHPAANSKPDTPASLATSADARATVVIVRFRER